LIAKGIEAEEKHGTILVQGIATRGLQYKESRENHSELSSWETTRVPCWDMPGERGGTEDHVHIACSLPRTLTQSKLLEETKRASSIWMKQQEGGPRNFSWQSGYGIFSLGQSQLPTLIQYIDNQEEHHRRKSFKEELLELLDKYDVVYDEKYLWD